MAEFHGNAARRGYFEGWYYKQQSQEGSVAFIPAYHVDRHGRKSASIQVLSQQGALQFTFDPADFHAERDSFCVRIGKSIFTKDGCRVDCGHGKERVLAELTYSEQMPPGYDIMGPFRLAPFLQCRHSVFSMRHDVAGYACIGGRKYDFSGGTGYMEGDRGYSFPKRYIWTQCFENEVSVMLSIASVPLLGISFTGCIGFVLLEGQEYRFGTYLGARPSVSPGKTVVRQGELTLTVTMEEREGAPLRAPRIGSMERTIRERLAGQARYKLEQNGHVLMDFSSNAASYENVWEA